MIEHIDIINLSHYDIGFTDHPKVCRELQVRFIDMAIDSASNNTGANAAEEFHWTCEANNAVLDWWQQATSQRQDLFLKQVADGWIDVCAMPFNEAPTMCDRQWQQLAHWLPEELWQKCSPRTILQSDVNGFPRAGIMEFLKRDVDYLWMGLNSDTGGPPLPQPSAFWWEMPDGRKIFVHNAIKYPDGYFLFEQDEWRRGPLPKAWDTRYRPPRAGEFISTAPAALQNAHSRCCAQIEEWSSQGYSFDYIAVPITNMWRVDNDPPCPGLVEFVQAWNAQGLKPSLGLNTATAALDRLHSIAADEVPTFTGEWTDWWSNGSASLPHELSANRRAKRVLRALESPLYQSEATDDATITNCWRQLCFFDEHTAGSWNSVAMPESLDTHGQAAEKALSAYRPLAFAELALGDANRKISSSDHGVHVVNPYDQPFTGWVVLTDDCLRGDYEGAEDMATGKRVSFDILPGPYPFLVEPTNSDQFTPLDASKVFPDNIAGKHLRLWVEALEPHAIRSFRLLEKVDTSVEVLPEPQIETDDSGWPISASWNGKKLFCDAIGDFVAMEVGGEFPRFAYKDLLELPTATERATVRDELCSFVHAEANGTATLRDTGPTLVFEQYLSHPRLRCMRRVLEIFKAEPRVLLNVVIDRIYKPESCEVFYLGMPLECPNYDLQISNGGVAFRPGLEQLGVCCKDYFASDQDVVYCKGEESVVLECHDNAVVAFGAPNDGLRLDQVDPQTRDSVYAILFNNVWYTNWQGNASGRMEYNFVLYASNAEKQGGAPEAFAVVQT